MKKLMFEVTDELVDMQIAKFNFNGDRDQLKKGIEVEQEHYNTVDGSIEKITMIAIDHLEEIPDYYTRLDAMEKEADKVVEEAIGEPDMEGGDVAAFLYQYVPEKLKSIYGDSPKKLMESAMRELNKEAEDSIDWFESFADEAAETFEVTTGKVTDRMIASEIIEQLNEKIGE